MIKKTRSISWGDVDRYVLNYCSFLEDTNFKVESVIGIYGDSLVLAQLFASRLGVPLSIIERSNNITVEFIKPLVNSGFYHLLVTSMLDNSEVFGNTVGQLGYMDIDVAVYPLCVDQHSRSYSDIVSSVLSSNKDAVFSLTPNFSYVFDSDNEAVLLPWNLV